MPKNTKLKPNSMPKLKFPKDFLINYFPKLLLTAGASLVILTYARTVYGEIKFYIDGLLGRSYKLETTRNTEVPQLGVKPLTRGDEITINPINKDFSLVIEKINVNAPVIKDVPIIDKEAYISTLKVGIAHASFSAYPNEENANVYLFAHSSNNFWELGKYSTVFNLLYKLNTKDEINLFYKGKRYVYQVENKILINDFKVDETIYEYFGPTLTLQTCYPPGTTLNRLVIRAGLIGVFEN